MAGGRLKQHVERAENLFNQVCITVEEKGLVDPPPRSRLKLETRQDSIWLGQFLWHVKRKKMPREEYARQFPVEWKRLQEILPRKEPKQAASDGRLTPGTLG